jgi:cobalt/nickel transport system ATP-binding protein
LPITVEDVAYTYPDGRQALDGVTLSLSAGECVAVLGPNGAGKTTLLLCLAGVLTPQRGRVRLSDIDPCDARWRSRLPATLGLLFSDSDDQLFCPTTREDVAFGLRNQGKSWAEAQPLVDAVLKELGLNDLAERSPHRLSTGEKRRVALAGLLVMAPAILLLDEPTSGLDPRGRRQLIDTLRQLPQTRLIATHDVELALDLCPRAILMDQGRVWADMETTALFQQRALLAEHGLEPPPRWPGG